MSVQVTGVLEYLETARARTYEGVLVSIQGGELLAVVAAERVAGVALVGPQSQPEALALGLQMEAAVLSVDFLVHPVLQLHQQLVVPLPPQLVDALQAEPVLPIHVAKATLSPRGIKERGYRREQEKTVHIGFSSGCLSSLET